MSDDFMRPATPWEVREWSAGRLPRPGAVETDEGVLFPIDLGDESLDGDLVPKPLFIDSNKMMAAFELTHVGTFYLLHIDTDDEGRSQFHYLWESPEGAVIDEGTDLYAPALATVDYPVQFASWFSFISADAEHYSYTLQMGTKTTCDEHDQHDMEYLAHAYQHSDEITMAHYDLIDEGDE